MNGAVTWTDGLMNGPPQEYVHHIPTDSTGLLKTPSQESVLLEIGVSMLPVRGPCGFWQAEQPRVEAPGAHGSGFD